MNIVEENISIINLDSRSVSFLGAPNTPLLLARTGFGPENSLSGYSNDPSASVPSPSEAFVRNDRRFSASVSCWSWFIVV